MVCRSLCLLLLALVAGSYAQPCALITPNILRLESEETIIVDGQNKAFDADIEIQDFPLKKFSLAKQKVSLNADNKFLGTAKLKIPSKELLKDQKGKQQVYVSVKSPVCNLEKIVLVGYQSGYIVIQTDKTIYTPGSTVLYRVFTMDYLMSPINKAVIIEFLTPENIIVKRETLKNVGSSGILSQSNKIPEIVSLGTWTISAKFEDSPLQNYTTNYEVKEYVLPTFEIQLHPEQSYFYVEDPEFHVDIKAKYLYGKDVNGKAFVIFGVKKDDVKTTLPDTLKRIDITDGEGTAVLEREKLLKVLKNKDEMLKYRIFLSVTIITDSGSDMVEAEMDDIYMMVSPFNIHFTKTSRYFKPGLPFHLTVLVTNPNGSPASRIQVVADPGKVEAITGPEGMTRLTLNTPNVDSLKINVKTNRPDLPEARQATASTTITAYKSNGNYLHIGITAAEVKPGENLLINFNIKNTNLALQNQIQHFTYVIMNKGRIMKVDRQPRLPGQTLVTISLPVTELFIPSFRIIAYYIVANEIVSDSVWVDVTDSCMGTLVVTGNSERDNKVQSPGSSMKLKLRADHKATVGLVAVDKGVFVLNNKYKVSQNKVWELVERSDLGCTPGSGADNMGVFYDAGLAFQSSLQKTTQQRTESQCEVRAARKRRSSAQLITQKGTYASKYKDLAGKCCKDGMEVNPMGHSCERRSRRILDGKECLDAFLDCCNYIEKKRAEEKDLKDKDEFGRSDEDNEYIPTADIMSRTEFPESWFWKLEHMLDRPDNNGISTKVMNVFLKDSITTWEVLAVSLSEKKGICVAKPYEIQVMKDFFIDLKLPYSVVRNEQVAIRAVLYNYGNINIKTRVELIYNEKFCSLSTVRSPFRQVVDIAAHSSRVVTFVIVPLELGQHDVEVKAAVFQTFLSDGVKKKLKVVPEGQRLTKNIKLVTLEPQVKGIDGVQEEQIQALDEKNIVPGTRVDTIVTIQGNPISQMVEGSIDGSNLNPLIVVPRGCGEQNMITMTPSVIATIFLDATGQWEKIGVNKREQAVNNIKQGYVQQLVYRKKDNSYAAFKERPASTWLTAYVAKVFAMAQSLVEIQSDVLCGAIKWLILEKQKPDGLFQETAPVIHQEMIGGFKGSKNPDAALTAFVLIAMLQSERTCTEPVNNLKLSIERASSFLLTQYPTLDKPYSIAIVTYALAMAGKIDSAEKLLSATTDKLHWEEPGSRFITLEATSYALLALLRLKQFELTGPIVRWITEQRYYGAVYGSTQATIVMFEALAQYQIDIPSLNEIDLDVSLLLPERQNPPKYRINLENAMLARSDTTNINANFAVKAKGKGQATLTVLSVYHAIETEKEKKCKNFDLSVKVEEEDVVKGPEGSKATVSIEICTRYLKDTDATMSILDVSMMTGFVPDIKSLNNLMKGVDKYISKFEINKEATDKGTLMIYLDKVSHKEDECVKFYAHQIFDVGLIQPAAVTVYDYYTPENRCTKFYHVQEGSKLLGRICQGEVCRCAEENCFMQQSQKLININAEERLDRACRPGVDYVFKARLDDIQHNENYDNYLMTIVGVIKEGTDENVKNKQKSFISHIKCRKALDLKKGRDYIIWGMRTDLWLQPAGYSYIIGKDTWIEWWPNNRECQDKENEELCEDFFNVAENLELNGCPS